MGKKIVFFIRYIGIHILGDKTDKYIALLKDGMINKEDFIRLITDNKKPSFDESYIQ